MNPGRRAAFVLAVGHCPLIPVKQSENNLPATSVDSRCTGIEDIELFSAETSIPVSLFNSG